MIAETTTQISWCILRQMNTKRIWQTAKKGTTSRKKERNPWHQKWFNRDSVLSGVRACARWARFSHCKRCRRMNIFHNRSYNWHMCVRSWLCNVYARAHLILSFDCHALFGRIGSFVRRCIDFMCIPSPKRKQQTTENTRLILCCYFDLWF